MKEPHSYSLKRFIMDEVVQDIKVRQIPDKKRKAIDRRVVLTALNGSNVDISWEKYKRYCIVPEAPNNTRSLIALGTDDIISVIRYHDYLEDNNEQIPKISEY